MKLRIHVPALPEGVEIDPERLKKALQWAIGDGWDPKSVWALNPVPAIAQLEEMVFQQGQNGLSDFYEALTTHLALPSHHYDLEAFEKARIGRKVVPEGQLGFNWDEEAHPRQEKDTVDPKYKPGEFVPKEHEAEKAPQDVKETLRLLSEWTQNISRAQDTAQQHMFGNQMLDLDTARRVLEQFVRDSDRYRSEIEPTDEGRERSKGLQQARANLVEGKLHTIVNELEDKEKRRKAEPQDLTPEQRAKLQIAGWESALQNTRQALADHQTGESPMTVEQLKETGHAFRMEYKYYEGELLPQLLKAENGPWIDRDHLDQKVNTLRRYSANTPDKFEIEADRTMRLEALGKDPGWVEKQHMGELFQERSADVQQHYGWKANQVDSESEEQALDTEGRQKAEALQKQARKLTAASKKEKAATAKHFKEAPRAGIGFTNKETPKDVEKVLPQSKWYWWDSPMKNKAGNLEMSPENWALVNKPTPLGPREDRMTYVGPLPGDGALVTECYEEAQRMHARLVKRVPQWLRSHIAEMGGETVFCAAPPYRIGFNDQESYDRDSAKEYETKEKSNDPRRWDDVAGFYRPNKKACFNQTGYSNPGSKVGCVNLELHEYGHMVDYMHNFTKDSDGKVWEGKRLSEDPEFVAIWNNLKPWLDNYFTKDDNAKELWAEGFGAFTESEENRRLMLSKDVPEPYRRLGRYFERFLAGKDAPITKGLWLRAVRKGGGLEEAVGAKTPNRLASGQTIKNGEEILWDGEPVHEEDQAERDPRFPSLFLKHPRTTPQDGEKGQ